VSGPPAAARDWDGASYDRLSAPMEALGREVLARLALRGDETVLDGGCGSGRVTEALLERLPRGRVIGVDASPSMIEAARRRLADRADLRVGDLAALDLGGETVDAVLSTATFHWIADHDALFRSLHGVLRPGGRLVAQCGGAGNIARVHAAARDAAAREPFAPHFAGWRGPWNFATPQDTERRLRAAGFPEAHAWLQERLVTPEDPRGYLRTINLGAHLERLPEDLREPFVGAVLDRLGERPAIDYVRLNIDATA
jgi:trans-aconitate 2-methyltransferase